MLIDQFMPAFDVAERHGIVIWLRRSGRTRDPLGGPDSLVRDPVLFALRGFPAVCAGRGAGRRGLTLDDFLLSGFVVLAEEPGVEIVLGVIGRFWRPTGSLVRFAPDEFTAFKQPGYAKAAWNFRVQPAGEGRVQVDTQTRVQATDEKSLKSFKRYWRVIGPFSGLIRSQMLRLVKAEAEQS